MLKTWIPFCAPVCGDLVRISMYAVFNVLYEVNILDVYWRLYRVLLVKVPRKAVICLEMLSQEMFGILDIFLQENNLCNLTR